MKLNEKKEGLRKNLLLLKSVSKEILVKRNYLLIFVVAGTVLFSIFYVFTLITTTDQSLAIFVMMNTLPYTIITFLLLLIAAALFGLYAALLVYALRQKSMAKRSCLWGSGGLVAGLFSAGCPMCGAFLFGLIGAPLALFFLPFKGLELRVLAIILLSLSIYSLGKSLGKCRC